jgi:transcriptional regulator of heat shock response
MTNKIMNQRQQKILTSIIEEYTNSAQPVSSELLVKKYAVKASPATIRNDMTKLEKEGLLYQPHISAGRIPTDKGYRYFVEEIMKDRELSIAEQKKLQAELLKLKAKNTRLERTVVKLLSGFSGALAITGATEKEEFFESGIKSLVNQPEFKSIDEVCKLAEVLDVVDEKFEKIAKDLKENETKIYIGEENPINGISNCSMVVSSYKLKGGEKGILALIGPKRMKYAKNKSLIEYMKKLLSSSTMIVIATGNIYLLIN